MYYKSALYVNKDKNPKHIPQLICGISDPMKNPNQRRITYTEHDEFLLSDKALAVYHAIFKETMLKRQRCAKLSLSDLQKMTGIRRSTIEYQLKVLERKRLTEVNKTEKTNTICFVTIYKEIYRI